ncbi:MAG: DUF488 domain-containing protein [Chloroflexi bacterium]|nr:DUF488 domain-containing protein [Chloroflexota bacterium]
MTETAPLVVTIGHSTRPMGDFLALLRAHHVWVVADVRTIPRSRRNPQFNKDNLDEVLRASCLEYLHVPGLGGLRRPRPGSPNTGWINDSFRGFADYMQTREFEQALQRITDLATRGTLALMCAEALPWRCHRSLIADALLVRCIRVEHILGMGRRRPHEITSLARVEGTRIVYPR